MSKVIRITEGDLTNIVKRVMNEQTPYQITRGRSVKIPYKYFNVREMIGDNASPDDIKNLYNELYNDNQMEGHFDNMSRIVNFDKDKNSFEHENGEKHGIDAILSIISTTLFLNDEEEDLTESDLTRIVKRVIIESNKQPTKAEILDMSEDELENLGKIKGEYLGKKGEFFNFKKKGIMGVICGFRTDDKTPDGLRKSYRSVKVKDNEVKFNQKKTSVNESDKEKDDKSSNETKIPLQLKLKFQKFLKSAKGEEGEDTYLDRRRDAFIKELDGYREMEVRTKLFQKLESEYGKVPGKFRAPFRWYK